MSSVVAKGLCCKLNSLVDESSTSTYYRAGHTVREITQALESMAAYLDDAEERAVENEQVNSWIQRANQVFSDVDDMIDEVHIMSSLPKQIPSTFRIIKTSPVVSKLASAFRCVRQDLDSMLKDAAYFHFQLNVKSAGRSKRVIGDHMHSYVPEEPVVGRESDKDAVTNLILKSGQRVSVVPIVGIPGIGKTTLAHFIYDNLTKKDEHFGFKTWTTAGNDDSSDHLICSIWESIYARDRSGRSIQQKKMDIRKLLERDRSLMVLDHFMDNPQHMSLVRELMDMASEGSSIIVTTRSRKAASKIGTVPAYELQPLSQDASCQLFTMTAFRTQKERLTPEHESIARGFVKSLRGWALALLITARLLCFKSIEECRRILHIVEQSGIENFLGAQHHIKTLSVFEIPSRLRLYIESFRLQKACGLSVEALICVWMALGYLYSDDPNQPPEYIGRKHLKELAECSLCPDVEYAPGGVVRHINFNNILHEAAVRSAPQFWCILRDEEDFLHQCCTHIIWDSDCLQGRQFHFDNKDRPPKVRLFMVRTGRQVSAQFVRNVVSCLGCLRVLGLGGCDLEMLPDSIDHLKHLRYIDLGKNPRMKSLPDSICNLRLLETLFLHGCKGLEELPPSIGMLRNLRYLTLTILKESLPEAIGQLTSLRTLGLFSCPKLNSLPSSIKHLKYLETLGIVDCPVLQLDPAASPSVGGLSGLAVHTVLLSKTVCLPSDLGNLSATLKHLQILFCTGLIEAQCIAQFRSLRSLTIGGCHQLSDQLLKEATSPLNRLFELVIRNCESLHRTEWIKPLVSLRSLIIDGCPKLVDLDGGFSKLKQLKRLEIRRCPILTEWFATPPAGQARPQIAHVQVIEVDGKRISSF